MLSTALNIVSSVVAMVRCTKFLGVHQTDNLTWAFNSTTTMAKKMAHGTSAKKKQSS